MTWHDDGRRLRRLIEALQHRGEHALRRAEDASRAPDVGRVDAADIGGLLRRPLGCRLAQLVEADGVGGEVIGIRPPVLEHLVNERHHECQIRARLDREMHIGPARGGRLSRIDHHQLRRAGAAETVEHARPQHGLSRRHVVSIEEQRVAFVDVLVAPGLTVRAECLLQGCGRRRRAQAGIAVHVRGSDACLADHSECVVLLEEQLAARVEAMAERADLVEERLAAGDDKLHRLVPARRLEPTVAPDHRCRQAIRILDALPARVEALRAQPTAIDRIILSAADADHATILDGDVAPAPVAAQHTG